MSVTIVVIPGLSMHRQEIPPAAGTLVLQNPGVDDAPDLADGYRLEEVAALHGKALKAHALADDVLVIGMSMGGAILSVLATQHRDALPSKARFRFLVTTANTPAVPAASDATLREWSRGRFGEIDTFREILAPFFSEKFRREHPDRAEAYYRYRAFGENRQSAKAFYRQVTAIRAFDGSPYFGALDPANAEIVCGAEDYVLGPPHHRELHRLAPAVPFHVVPDLGHMANLEAPRFFSR